MKNIFKTNKKLIIVVASLLCVAIFLFVFAQSRFNVIPQLVASTTSSKEKLAFPEIDSTKLSEEQNKVVAILKTEYVTNPAGTKYSEGNEEPWCADFVSWVLNEAGAPLSNPNSGSWRIPGTYTLRDYYESVNKFKPADSDYSPKIGDIMLYDNPSPFGQHTNMVIKNDNGTVTTIGGNEPGGIRVITHTTPDDAGFVGYGVL